NSFTSTRSIRAATSRPGNSLSFTVPSCAPRSSGCVNPLDRDTRHDSDGSLHPLLSNDGPQRLYQPKRMGAVRLRAHTHRVWLLATVPQVTSGAFSFYPHGKARPIVADW